MSARNFVPKPEPTPMRFSIERWNYGTCKRCLRGCSGQGPFVIVKFEGLGWFHDTCYRIVNPDYYQNLDDSSSQLEDSMPMRKELQSLLKPGTNWYETPKPVFLWRFPNLIHAFAVAEHDGKWVLNERRNGGKRQLNGVTINSGPERVRQADEDLAELYSYLTRYFESRGA